jgi:hypothetical protein
MLILYQYEVKRCELEDSQSDILLVATFLYSNARDRRYLCYPLYGRK